MLRRGLVWAWLALLFSGVAALFWYNNWKYLLPTPVPVNYKEVPAGTLIDLAGEFHYTQNKPVFVHFYNPDCPCSRFNKAHFRSLVREYGHQVDFLVVVMTDKKFSADYIREKIGEDIPVIFDQTIAERCGVYSTPQAVILDREQRLYYRGNYNSSRYCTEEKTAYAKIALTGLLKWEDSKVFDAQALKSYGCTLPVCKN